MIKLLKREPVLVISALCALLSMVFVRPDKAYIGYIDLRVLGLLFCLMAVVAGLQRAGLFDALARSLLAKTASLRQMYLLLVLLPFFSAMLITNDVALITFVPFAVLALQMAGQQRYLLPVVVMQTVAANLGSMLTPVGNPQNLFLYNYYPFTMGSFVAAVAPVTLASLVILVITAAVMPKRAVQPPVESAARLEWKALAPYLVLLVLSLLSVARLLPWQLVLAVTLAWCLLRDRALLGKVDWCLLLTFVCFFIFSGNLARIEPVRQLLQQALEGRTALVSALASQVISNVPAAMLLAPFTGDARGLLLGVNIGGLGTLVASLASLISFKIYSRTPGSRPGRYLLWFTVINVLLLAAMLLFFAV